MSQDRIEASISIGGNASGNLAVGKDVSQHHITAAAAPPTSEDWQRLDDEFAGVRQHIDELAPEQAPAAQERLDELHEAITAEQPDLSTMEYVNGWFARNLPHVAQAVSGLIANPVVKAVVTAAGDAAASEFRRRFPQP